MPSQSEPRELLKKAIRQCVHRASSNASTTESTLPIRLNTEKFFQRWYVRPTRGYFFLFEKNLRVTNVQFAELLALIRVHHKPSGRNAAPQRNGQYSEQLDSCSELQFSASPDFHFLVEKLFQPFLESCKTLPLDRTASAELDKLVVQYAELLLNLVIFDCYFGSCVVYTPPNIEIDLKAVCAYAGYVHSCGIPVYVRNVNEAKTRSLMQAVKARVPFRRKGTSPVRLIVYAHEEFSKSDRGWEDELRHGLDDVKLYEHKFFLGGTPLVRALQRLKDGVPARGVVLTRPSLSRPLNDRTRRREEFDKARSLWLITDRSVARPYNTPGESRYLICYEQRFKNCNPTHIFDENKPAWVSQTTIPHSLMGAMINLTKPWWPRKGTILCADPFAGSGTTWFEAEKHNRVLCTASDIAPISQLLIADNYHYLSAKAAVVKRTVTHLNKLGRQIKGASSTNRVLANFPAKIKSLLSATKRKGRNNNRTRSLEFVPRSVLSLDALLQIKPLQTLTPDDRLVLYLAARADVRHAMALEAGRENWVTAFLDEMKKLTFQLKALLNLRNSQEHSCDTERISLISREYSHGCVVWPERFERFSGKHKWPLPAFVRGVESILDGIYDFIVTDPPYGYNEGMSLRNLFELYANLFDHLIRALKEEGQLVVAVPDTALTGKPFPIFTTKHTIIHQVLQAARKQGREVIRSAYIPPQPGSLFYPPYYWEAGSYLRRAILHFRFRRRTS